MSVAVDANLLLYAANASDARHARAREMVDELAHGSELVFLFWPVIMAFLRIATHPSIFPVPLTPGDARHDVEALLVRPQVRAPGEPEGFWATFQEAIQNVAVRGNLVTDAHLVALMRSHGVNTMLSGDRDFRKFDGIRVRDPFG